MGETEGPGENHRPGNVIVRVFVSGAVYHGFDQWVRTLVVQDTVSEWSKMSTPGTISIFERIHSMKLATPKKTGTIESW